MENIFYKCLGAYLLFLSTFIFSGIYGYIRDQRIDLNNKIQETTREEINILYFNVLPLVLCNVLIYTPFCIYALSYFI